MKTRATIRFFFGNDRFEAARKRLEVGAPEGFDKTETISVDADIPLASLERGKRWVSGAEAAHINEPKYLNATLPAEMWGLPPEVQIEQYIDALNRAHSAYVDEHVAKMLSYSDERWTDHQNKLSAIIPFPYYTESGVLKDDPRIVERLEKVQASLDEKRKQLKSEQWKAYSSKPISELYDDADGVIGALSTRYHLLNREQVSSRFAEFEAEHEKRKAEAAARYTQLEDAFRAYAVERGGDMAEAAREGYSVAEAVISDVIERLRAESGAIVVDVLRHGTQRYHDTSWEERDSPSMTAVKLWKALTAAAESIALPKGLSLDVLRVMRVELADGRKLTGVIVDVETELNAPDRAVVFSAENR